MDISAALRKHLKTLGSLGGKKRMAGMSKSQRVKLASVAAKARWRPHRNNSS